MPKNELFTGIFITFTLKISESLVNEYNSALISIMIFTLFGQN